MGLVESSLKRSRKSNLTADAISTMKYIRRAQHAGSWYSSDRSELDGMLTNFLEEARSASSSNLEHDEKKDGKGQVGIPRACICPHAGFQYSGPTAAFSFLALEEAVQKNLSLRTIVVLHPSHHVYLDGCAISGAAKIETPLGNLEVDNQLREQLLLTGKFTTMKRSEDEDEHSGEMQYPFISKVLSNSGMLKQHNGNCFTVRVLPIMVGSIRPVKEEAFGKLFSSVLCDPEIFTVISSDFCHWGKRFGYVPLPSSNLGVPVDEVYEYIQHLDRKGMDIIEMQKPGAFADYLREYSNTICGRHPIGVWLHSVVVNAKEGRERLEVRFVKYDQSGKARSIKDSSVSYASAVARSLPI
mmetsp:Transcript_31571/g.67046  ORF Transcript_31571/g.67046 Transcript_31571/m.67046 type:complete len:356 (-) Transcript_31571:170-1237(-)